VRREPEPFVGYFPGPAAEAGDLVRSLVDTIVDDHLHWRRNYFPGDPPFMRRSELRYVESQHDELEGAVRALLAKLRRSLPFHSPRYVAHQQSELSLPSLLGSVAGLLYNANNVTSESGNVTLELELEATSRLLEMLGYNPPPALPQTFGKEEIDRFEEAAQRDFAWCHLCSGGTSANIEALWVARNVTYQTLAVAKACEDLGILLEVPRRRGEPPRPLTALTPKELLNLPPRVAIRLLPDFLSAAGSAHAGAKALKLTGRHIENLPALMGEYRPVVFVAGTAHYSIKKAADLLGIGAAAVCHVPTDSRHRIDVEALKAKVAELKPDQIPLAVIGIVGTTEEGAVDPIHEIVSWRTELEGKGTSFWLHVDAAWGGYFRAMTRPSDRTMLHLRSVECNKFLWPEQAKVKIDNLWFVRFVAKVIGDTPLTDAHRTAIRTFESAVGRRAWTEALDALEGFARMVEVPPGVSDETLRAHISQSLAEDLFLQVRHPDVPTMDALATIGSPDDAVLRALQAMPEADSITIDPHKMGYQHYACGAIAFRDSRVWHYVYQRTPYLSSSRDTTPFVHRPMLAVEKEDGVAKLVTNVVGMYVLEGSRPSAPAAALWLSTKVMPLDEDNHGRLVRASWLAAQELYAWLTNWATFEARITGRPPTFRFVPLTVSNGEFVPPDSNLVIFGVKPTADHTLAEYNRVSKAVYDRFRISAEAGERRYSYDQPFFLSTTTFDVDAYPTDVIQPIADVLKIADFATAYPDRKMRVIRASVMNPYLYLLRLASDESKDERSNLLGDLVEGLAAVAREAVSSRPSPDQEGQR
jgi:glutamate/tyrosine decarboxylase-like PLP-dependent enzyme